MQAASIPHSFKSRLLWPMGFIGAGTASITYSNIEDSTLTLYMLQNEGTERNRTSRKVCNQAEQQARSEASSLLCRTQETTNNTQSFIESVSMMFACHAAVHRHIHCMLLDLQACIISCMGQESASKLLLGFVQSIWTGMAPANSSGMCWFVAVAMLTPLFLFLLSLGGKTTRFLATFLGAAGSLAFCSSSMTCAGSSGT